MARAKQAVEETVEATPKQTRSRGTLANLHLTIPLSLDVRLTAQAKAQRTPKCRFAEVLLDQSLSKYKTDRAIKAAFELPTNEDSEAA